MPVSPSLREAEKQFSFATEREPDDEQEPCEFSTTLVDLPSLDLSSFFSLTPWAGRQAGRRRLMNSRNNLIVYIHRQTRFTRKTQLQQTYIYIYIYV